MKRELESRQTQILAVMEGVDRFLGASEVPNLVALGELRIANERMLAEHVAFKHGVYRSLRACGIAHVDKIVARSRSATVALHVAFRFHQFDWSPEVIAGDWPGYVLASRALIARMCVLIESDRQALYPLLDQLMGDRVAPMPAPEQIGIAALTRSLTRHGELRTAA